MPPYSCVDGRFWPDNRLGFLYAAKYAREGYASSLGPSSFVTAVDSGLQLSAYINDNAYGTASGSRGRPNAQTMVAAEYYVDTPPWLGGSGCAMDASDGTFDASAESVSAKLSIASLANERHRVFVRGRDANGNWGPVTAQWFTVQSNSPRDGTCRRTIAYVDRNNTGFADGTAAHPFPTISAALGLMAYGGTIVIAAGNYNEIGTFSRPVTLRAKDGTVVLGAP